MAVTILPDLETMINLITPKIIKHTIFYNNIFISDMNIIVEIIMENQLSMPNFQIFSRFILLIANNLLKWWSIFHWSREMQY